MRRIPACFERLAAEGRKGLIAFITAGDPNAEATPVLMRAIARGGADVIELGVPFSDPMADGPVIQRASERALVAGTTLDDVLRCVSRFREQDAVTPVVLMGYLNTFECMGAGTFAERASQAGVDGALVVDLPPEEARDFNQALVAAGLEQIFLAAPNSSSERIDLIRNYASGFVYFVAVKGVTGDKAAVIDAVQARIAEVRARAGLPVGIGFGIRTPQAAAMAARAADAVIVGSALVEAIEQAHDVATAGQALQQLVAALRQAIDQCMDAA